VASIFITTLVTAGLEKFMKKPLAVALSVALPIVALAADNAAPYKVVYDGDSSQTIKAQPSLTAASSR
jgi:hypothetical protein